MHLRERLHGLREVQHGQRGAVGREEAEVVLHGLYAGEVAAQTTAEGALGRRGEEVEDEPPGEGGEGTGAVGVGGEEGGGGVKHHDERRGGRGREVGKGME